MLSIFPLASKTPKVIADDTITTWAPMTSFLGFSRSAKTPPHGPKISTGNALTATVKIEWSAEPVISNASQPRVMNWSHWAQLAKRLPVHRYL